MVKCQQCPSRARFGTPELGPILCSKHKEFGMKDQVTKQCYYDGCDKRAIFGIDNAISCGSHKYPHYKNLNAKKCKWCEMPATHGSEYGKATVCRTHANNERDIRHKECKHEGCYFRASFTDDMCSKHSKTKDRKEKSKLCELCSTLASFAYQSADKPIRCKAHKDEGMINVRLKKRLGA